jgi:hypothetical protein
VANVAAQRAAVTIVPVAIGTCTLLKFADLVLTEIDLLKAVRTGELESEQTNLDYFFEQAKEYCEAVVPED